MMMEVIFTSSPVAVITPKMTAALAERAEMVITMRALPSRAARSLRGVILVSRLMKLMTKMRTTQAALA
jgi:hypothetical protein